MSARTTSLPTIALALAILLIGGGVRFWNLGWGLADSVAFPDEVLIWPTYFRSFVPLEPSSFLRPERFSAFVYPSAYGNLSGLLGAAAHALGFVPESAPNNSQVVYIARLVTASASLATVALVMLAARAMFDRRTALIAGILMALVPLCVFRAHYANVDSLLVMWITAVLIAAFFLAERGTTSAAILAGLCTGFAFGTKYTGVAVGALVAWAVIEVAWRRGSWGVFFRLGTLALTGCALGFFLACPACWFQYEYWLEALNFLSFVANWDYIFFWRHHLVPSLGWYGRPYLYQLFASLPFSLGWPLYALAVLGVGRALMHRGRPERLLLLLLVVFFLPMGTSIEEAPRYQQPLTPTLVLLSAHFLATTMGRRARIGVVAVVAAYSAIFAIGQVSELHYRQQQGLVEFLRAELPQRPGGKRPRVGLPSRASPYYRIVTPLRAAGLAPRPLPAEEWFTADIDAFVLPETYVVTIRRSYPDRPDFPAIEALESGVAGWHEAARWDPGYWAKGHYTVLDPGFAADLLPGAQGFRVFLRGSEPTERP